MRVLLVNAHGLDLAEGGAEKYVSDLAAGLERRGDAVEILAAFPPRVEGSNGKALVLHSTGWRENSVRRIRNHLGDLVSNPSSHLADVITGARPDVVHTSNLPGITTALWEVCRRLGVPVVHTIHDYYLLCPRVTLQEPDGTPCCRHRMFCGLRTARLARWSEAVQEVICVSDHVRRRHESVLAGARFHVVRIPPAPLAGEPLRAPRTPPRTIGYLGTLSRMKGVTLLVEAAPRLAALGYVVQVAGEGRLRPLVEGAAARGELRYVGAVYGEDKRGFVESTDLAVLPATWEEPGAPPYAVAEWLAAGRPIMVARRGGLEEVGHRFAGAVAIEAGADGIVEAARALAAEEPWRELVGSIPPPEETAMDEWVDRHREIYELAAAGRSGGPDGRRRTSAT